MTLRTEFKDAFALLVGGKVKNCQDIWSTSQRLNTLSQGTANNNAIKHHYEGATAPEVFDWISTQTPLLYVNVKRQ